MDFLLFADVATEAVPNWIAATGGITSAGLLLFVIVKISERLNKSDEREVARDNFMRAAYKELADQCSGDRHAGYDALATLSNKLYLGITEQQQHDAREGKYEREACEKKIEKLAAAIEKGNTVVGSALDRLETTQGQLGGAIAKLAAMGHHAIDATKEAGEKNV